MEDLGEGSQKSSRRLVAIVGPTGPGKSRLAVRLAEEFAGEIVSADSRQVYRHMDIGTAKPSPEELERVPHHLISIINPDEPFSLAQYLVLARKAIEDIFRRGKVPFVVGGTGQYVKALLEGWQVPEVPPDGEFRYNREKEAFDGDADALYVQLVAVDPQAAAKIDRRNIRRVIRALEVYNRAGKTFSQLRIKNEPSFCSLMIGLTTGRAELYAMVDRRIDRMIETGLVQEVAALLHMGYGPDLPSMTSIGYRQMGQYLEGKLSLEEAIGRMKAETHRFIRHQYAWFRRDDPKIRWFDIRQDPEKQIMDLVGSFLKGEMAS
ncbi:MAG: tRNA (adenosine(37)-N6)-dimethylallyltransferase MiaA [Dehalococcoidales bacterium]|nr:tRNA (adenosine(37)-N6)-dimethylallyltransferase MiaA [Dehalococcoidales bacterium]